MSNAISKATANNAARGKTQRLPMRLLPFVEIMGWNCHDSRDEIADGYTVSVEWLGCVLQLTFASVARAERLRAAMLQRHEARRVDSHTEAKQSG